MAVLRPCTIDSQGDLTIALLNTIIIPAGGVGPARWNLHRYQHNHCIAVNANTKTRCTTGTPWMQVYKPIAFNAASQCLFVR